MPRTPQPDKRRFVLTDAGLETDMIYNRGQDLPLFSSSTLLTKAEGREALTTYFREFLDLARDCKSGFVLESPSWRASPDWAEPLGFTQEKLDELNREAIRMMARLAADYPDVDTFVSGCIGPRGDGYDPGQIMSAEEAEAYHARQIGVMVDAGADMITAITMTNIPEAIGIAQAAQRIGAPVVISLTVETDGTLPSGDTLQAAIEAVDDATGAYPSYFMVNCAHPTHFADTLDPDADWTRRIQGVRANASRCSHAELDQMTSLDRGDVEEFGALYADLRRRLPGLTVLGGCCGTDFDHIRSVAQACSTQLEPSEG